MSAPWFAWDGTSLRPYSVVRGRRWADLRRDPRVAVVGEIPRAGELCAELDAPETLFTRKNFDIAEMPYEGRHAWIRLTPDRTVSDFRRPGSS